MKILQKGYRLKKAAVSLFIFLFLVAGAARAEEKENPYLDELLVAAEKKELYKARYWEVLLHYKRAPFGGIRSLVDDPAFFLSPGGKIDPRKELQATIRAFFEEDTGAALHPRCRFPGRYEWLKETLPIDESRLPQASCAELDAALKKVDPRRAVLIFPAAYMNAPASMFGHTLIRIDGGYQSKLVSYAANYAASVTDTNGFLYAFKGIFGYYRGYYSVLPYYEKVKEYNDLEQRDMWEYGLNLTDAEVRRMFLHLWELKDIYSYYYFFGENCSYNLLFLLEAARPSSDLTDGLKPWVIPVDTLREVKARGLVENTGYRPSKAAKMKRIAAGLDEHGRESALKIAGLTLKPGEVKDAGNEERIRIYDLAVEALQYRYGRNEVTKDEYQKQFLAALSERSTLGPADEGAYRTAPPPPPEAGHDSSRASIGAGVRKGNPFEELRLRPAYHDLLDPDEGYQKGSQMVFLDLAGRYYDNGGGLRLENLNFVDIVSLAPRDFLFKPYSWKVKAGFAQKTLGDGEDHLVADLNTGGGLAFENGLIGLWYVMIEADVNVSNRIKDGYAVGAGPSAGLIKNVTASWKVMPSARVIYYELGGNHRSMKLSLDQSLRISRNNSLFLLLSGERVFGVEKAEAKLSWNIYF